MSLTTKQKEFIKTIGKAATVDQLKTGVLASITVAQAILESAYGTSELATNANNLFGIKDNNTWKGDTYVVVSKEEINGKLVGKTSKFRKYVSWSDSIADHSEYLCTRSLDGKTKLYKDVIGETDYKKAANVLQKSGYSTYSNYAKQLIDLIERYNLAQYDYNGEKEETIMAINIRIMLDAGHGGKDSGAVLSSRREKDDVLKLVLDIGKKLSNDYSNITIGYTRKTDVYESVTKKRQDSNSFKADYLFSFHRNSYNKKAKGYETLYYSHSKVKDAIMNDIAKEMKKIGFELRGDKQRKDLGVLKADAPALLFEVGFIDNKEDNKIFDNKYTEIVNAYVKVIANNCGLKKKQSTTTKTESTVSTSSANKTLKAGDENKKVQATKDCPIRESKSSSAKQIGTLKKGEKITALYVSKNSVGNLWASVDYGKNVGYIYLGNVKAI